MPVLSYKSASDDAIKAIDISAEDKVYISTPRPQVFWLTSGVLLSRKVRDSRNARSLRFSSWSFFGVGIKSVSQNVLRPMTSTLSEPIQFLCTLTTALTGRGHGDVALPSEARLEVNCSPSAANMTFLYIYMFPIASE